MVDHQILCRERIGASRHVRRGSPDRPSGLPALLHERRSDLVLLVTEANGYPYNAIPRHPEELVHLVALRLATGDLFDELASPVAPLHPSTTVHIAVPAADLTAAPPLAALRERWRAFARPSDVICTWGTQAARLAGAVLGEHPPLLDLRSVAGNLRQGAPGSQDAFAAWLGEPPLSVAARGRAGRRIATLGAVLQGLLARRGSGGGDA
jgi:hypothetical protein